MNTLQQNQPNWDLIAEKFDLWIPQLAPVGEALIKALKVMPGERILDVATGTGEPGLTLARRFGSTIHLTAIDAAEGMIRAARKKACAEGLNQVEFHTMAAEAITLPEESFDALLSRFGVMLFADVTQGLQAMHRVLKPGGRYALAVWSTPESMTTLCWAQQVFKERLPSEVQPPIAAITSLGQPGAFASALHTAGYRNFTVTPLRFNYMFADVNTYWQTIIDSGIMQPQLDALKPGELEKVRGELAALAASYQTDQGLVIPHEFLLANGIK